MSKRLSVLGLIPFACLALPTPLHAAVAARIVASDDRGLTVRLEVPAWRLAPADEAGFQRMVVPGFDATDVPGRPGMPYASLLIALPPGARATARVEQ